MNIIAGVLSLNAGGTSSGSFTVDTNDGLQFTGGSTYTLQGATISGAGSMITTATNLNAVGAYSSTISKTTITSGVFNFDGTANLTGNLVINGGTFAPLDAATVGGTLTWTVGNIGLSTLITLTDVTITGLTTLSTSTKSLFKKKLILNGGGNWTAGDINFYNSSILEIPALQTLTYNAAANYSLGNGSGTNSVNIQGTLIKQGTGTLTANTAFNNTGSVNLTAGVLSLNAGGTSSGNFNTSIVLGMRFTGGTMHNLQSGATFSGTGSVQTTGLITASGATFNSTVGAIEIGSNVFSSTGTFNHTGNLTIISGTFAPEGTATIGGNLSWTSNGSIGVSTSPSVSDIAIAGTTTIDGNTTRTLVKRKLILNGGGTWTLGSISVNQGGILEIGTGQILNYNSSGGYSLFDGGGTGNAFNVKGTLNIQAAGLSSNIAVNNTGIINVTGTNSTFSANGGGISSGIFNSNAASPNGIKLVGGTTHTLTTTATFSGTGNVDIQGVVNATAAAFSSTVGEITVRSNTFSSVGTINHTGNLTVVGGTFAPEDAATIGGNLSWTSNGSIGVSTSPSVSYIAIAGTTTIDGNTTRNLVKRRLILNGGGTWTLGSISISQGGILEIGTGQTLNYNSSGGYSLFDGGGTGNSFDIKGNLVIQAAQLTINIPINNTGVINLSGGNLIVNNAHSGNGSISVAATRQLTIGLGAGLNYGNSTFVNNGTLATNTLIFNGSIPQTLSGNGNINNLTLNNANDLIISGAQTISTALTFTNGKILLQNGDLTIGASGSIAAANSTKFVVTQGTGRLIQTVGTTDKIFPIGSEATSYNPVTLKQASGTAQFGSKVKLGFDNPLNKIGSVNRQWTVDNISGTPNATLGLSWVSPTHETGAFSTASTKMYRWNGTAWSGVTTIGAATLASGIHTRTQSALTQFSPFVVSMCNPPAPSVSNVVYCQNDVATALTASGTSLLWYAAATGGTGSATAPIPSTATAGTTSYFVSQTDDCESARAEIQVLVKPLPTVSMTMLNASYCQLESPVALSGSPAGGTSTIDGNVATSFDPSVLSLGNHAVVYSFTAANGCTNTISQTVAVTTPTNYTFNATSGNWNVASNWLPVGIPTSCDNVTIPVSKTVNLNVTGITVDNMISSGNVEGANNISIDGNLSIDNGSFANEGAISVGGTLAWAGGSIGSTTAINQTDITVASAASFSGDNKDLVKKKLLLNGGGTWASGDISLASGSTFEVPTGQTFTYNSSNNASVLTDDNALNLVSIKGTITKQGNGELGCYAPFNSTGSVNISAGLFALNGGGASTGSILNNSSFATNNFNFEIGGYSGNGSVSNTTTLIINTIDGLNYPNAVFANNGQVIGNALNFIGTTQQTLTGGSVETLNLNNANDLAIPNGATIGNLNFISGKVLLSDADLSINNTITGVNANRYIRTNGLGQLSIFVSLTEVEFPIGQSDYTPVFITSNGINFQYRARVNDGIDNTRPLSGTAFVTKEWHISESPAAIASQGTQGIQAVSNAASVKFQWNSPTDEGNGFTTTGARLIEYDESLPKWLGLPVVNSTFSCASGICSVNQTDASLNGSIFSVALPSAILPVTITGLDASYCKSAAAFTLAGTPENGTFTIDGNVTTTFDPSLLTVGNHTVVYTATELDYSNSATQIVEIISPTAPSVSNVSYCQNTTATALTATGTNLLWYSASTGGAGTTTAPTPSTTSAGTTSYFVSQTVNGCESTRSEIQVTVNATPAAPSVSSVIYCQNTTATALTATGTNLLWYSASTGGTGSTTAPTPSTTSAGTTSYFVSQTVNGCESARSEIQVAVNPLPTVSITGLNASYCKGGATVTLTGLPVGGTFTVDGVSATAFVPTLLTVGNHVVVYSVTGNGCTNSASQIVAVNALPNVSIVGLNANYCTNAAPIDLGGSPTGGVFTIDGTTASIFDPSVLSLGNHLVIYSVTENGCTNTASQAVAINALPVVSITGLNASYCQGTTSVTLVGSPIGGIFTIDGNTATSFDPSVLNVGNHTVVYSVTANGCTNTANQMVTITNSATASITNLNSSYCQNATSVTPRRLLQVVYLRLTEAPQPY